MKMKGLGRGLDALLADNDSQHKEQQRTLPVDQLQPGKYQPRTRMDPASLEELAASATEDELAAEEATARTQAVRAFTRTDVIWKMKTG